MSVTDGRQLKAGRVILGMTINDMAKAAGINRNSVLRVEARHILSYHDYAAFRIQVVLEVLGVSFTVQDGLAGVLFQAASKRQKSPYRKKTKNQGATL